MYNVLCALASYTRTRLNAPFFFCVLEIKWKYEVFLANPVITVLSRRTLLTLANPVITVLGCIEILNKKFNRRGRAQQDLVRLKGLDWPLEQKPDLHIRLGLARFRARSVFRAVHGLAQRGRIHSGLLIWLPMPWEIRVRRPKLSRRVELQQSRAQCVTHRRAIPPLRVCECLYQSGDGSLHHYCNSQNPLFNIPIIISVTCFAQLLHVFQVQAHNDKGLCRSISLALFSCRNEKILATIVLSFVCGKYYLIID